MSGQGGLRRIHAAVLLPPIGILSIVIVGLTGAAYNVRFSPDEQLASNIVSESLMGYTNPAATLAIAAVIAGAWFAVGKAQSWVTAASAYTTALVAWAFGLVAFGFACKQAEIGNRDNELGGGLKSLGGVTIFLVILETIYLLLLHLILVRTANS